MAKAPQLNDMTAPEDETVELPLEEATHGQLLWFSKMQGYEFDEAESMNQTYSRIKAAWDHATISVPKVIPQNDLHNPAPRTLTTGPEDRCGLPEKVTVRIAHDGDEQQDEYQNLAHDGVVFRVRKGVDVEIPWYVYKGCLLDAQELRYSAGRDSGIGEARLVQAIPFSRVK